jgi:hypothetical protein
MPSFSRFLERRMLALAASVCLPAVTASLVWQMPTLTERVDARPQRNVVGASWNLRDATWQLARAGRGLRIVDPALASSERRESLGAIYDETLHSANSLIAGGNHNLNEGVLPLLTADLGQVQASLVTLTAIGRTATLLEGESGAGVAGHLFRRSKAGALVERLWKPRVEVVNTVKVQSQQ